MACAASKASPCVCWTALDAPTGVEIYQGRWMREVARRHGLCVNTIAKWAGKWECQICESDISEPAHAFLDHDHATGRPRGVVCRRCNYGLAYLDKPEWMERAKRYLAKHEQSVNPQEASPPEPEEPRAIDGRPYRGIRQLKPDRFGAERWQIRVSKGPQRVDGRTIYPEITRVVFGSRDDAEMARWMLKREFRARA